MISIDCVPQTSMDLLRTIIINQMGLKPEVVNIYDEKWKIPPTDELFIVLEYRSGKVIANRNIFVSDGEDPVENQEVNMLEQIVVGIFSRDRSATQRKEEVLMAILSSYAERQQEKYSFKIARVGPIVDLSAVEGVAMLKRYDIDLSVYAWYSKTISPEYIDSYNLRVTANVGNTTMKQNVIQRLTPLT